MLNKLKNFKSKLGKWFWVIVVVLVLGIGGYFIFGRKSQVESVTVSVQKGEVKEELILTGSVKADKYATLAFPTGGKIAAVYVKEGQWVKKGQALTSLDKITLNAVYEQALNNYRNYQAAAENALDSVKGHSGDETFTQKATRTAAEVARDNAYDAVKAAEYNLRNATIFAPFEGLIASLPFSSPGVNVNITDTQVEILDPASIYFEVDADQSEVVSIKKDQTVTVVLDSYRDKEFSGTVSFVGYTPEPGVAGTIYKVKVEFIGNDIKEVLPRIGMTGDAKFILSQKEDVLYVAPKFVHSDKDGRYVNLGGKGKKARVTVGIEGEERVEITNGVKEGDILYD
jgi:RND family efflux transporter MFP subunit